MTRYAAISTARSKRPTDYRASTQERDEVIVTSIPIPEPAQDQLQVKIVAASLCHSDLMMSQRPDNLGPLTIGHEAVGVVSKIHSSAEGRGFSIGDRVGMLAIIDTCFTCEGCQVHGSFCVKSTKGGPKIQGLQADGCFAEYAVADWASTIHLPNNLPIERMSPLFCAGITGESAPSLVVWTCAHELQHSTPSTSANYNQASG